ncbi:MAG: hypothetical protein HIU83_17830 [Proteobacteria bacterium]|nr:hypothetical protein [Pseudomonadota bacterium]
MRDLPFYEFHIQVTNFDNILAEFPGDLIRLNELKAGFTNVPSPLPVGSAKIL